MENEYAHINTAPAGHPNKPSLKNIKMFLSTF
jgi:hypothetical protein